MQREASDNSSFTASVVDILQHLAQQEQGEQDWARRVHERAIADLDAETRTQAENG